MKKQSKKNKSTKNIIPGIIVTLLVMVTLIGLTYAFYRTRVVGNSEDKTIDTPTKMLRVEYEDNSPTVVTDNKFEPGKTLEKSFKVKNTGDDIGNYSIILDNIENENERTWDIRYTLKKAGKELIKGTLGKELKKQMVYADIEIGVNKTDEYTLELEYENPDEDQSIDMGKSLSFKIDIIEASENIFEELAEPNTLLYAIGRENKIVNPLTIPGKQVSSENEAELSYTEDDYGTSYYFRGNVQNNYVTFAGMCWRIVRVLGNGSIKIILYDESDCITSKNEEDIVDKKNAALINEGQRIEYNTNFSEKANFNFKNSNVVTVLSNWIVGKKLNNNLNINNQAEWCVDMSEVITNGSNSLFGSLVRLKEKNIVGPNLKCNFIGDNESKAEKYKSEIALLNVDEVAFAGATYNRGHNYLDNHVNDAYWTMSPASMDTDSSYIWRIYPNQGFYNLPFYSGIVRIGGAVRPSLVLKSNVTISKDGNGTQQNPYTLIET